MLALQSLNLVLTLLCVIFFGSAPLTLAQFTREEKSLVEAIAKSEARLAVQDERIQTNAAALRELQLEMGRVQGSIAGFQSELAWLKGMGFGFGALLSALNAAQLIIQIRRRA